MEAITGTSHHRGSIDSAKSAEMPSITFRDGKVCPGLGKADDDRLAKTSPVYLRLELAQAAIEILDEFQAVE